MSVRAVVCVLIWSVWSGPVCQAGDWQSEWELQGGELRESPDIVFAQGVADLFAALKQEGRPRVALDWQVQGVGAQRARDLEYYLRQGMAGKEHAASSCLLSMAQTVHSLSEQELRVALADDHAKALFMLYAASRALPDDAERLLLLAAVFDGWQRPPESIVSAELEALVALRLQRFERCRQALAQLRRESLFKKLLLQRLARVQEEEKQDEERSRPSLLEGMGLSGTPAPDEKRVQLWRTLEAEQAQSRFTRVEPRNELALERLGERRYQEALDLFLISGYKAGVALCLERLLSLDEIKSFDLKRVPAERAIFVRVLLQRRLMRAGCIDEALAVCPEEARELLLEYRKLLAGAEEAARPKAERAELYWSAAQLLRDRGAEMMGVWLYPHENRSLEPQYMTIVRDGDATAGGYACSTREELGRMFLCGAEALWRANPQVRSDADLKPGLRLLIPVESEPRHSYLLKEFTCGPVHVPLADLGKPDIQEVHGVYRLMAGRLGYKACALMPNGTPELALRLHSAGSWIANTYVIEDDDKSSRYEALQQEADVYYKELVRRCRRTALARVADERRWFLPVDDLDELESLDPGDPRRRKIILLGSLLAFLGLFLGAAWLYLRWSSRHQLPQDLAKTGAETGMEDRP